MRAVSISDSLLRCALTVVVCVVLSVVLKQSKLHQLMSVCALPFFFFVRMKKSASKFLTELELTYLGLKPKIKVRKTVLFFWKTNFEISQKGSMVSQISAPKQNIHQNWMTYKSH